MNVHTLWFILLGTGLTLFAIFDGLNLGIGAMHFILGRKDEERHIQNAAIGPLWWGYEVYLLVGGGAMVAAFPLLYARSFSGFYLVLTLVLWLLIMRGASLEMRHLVPGPLWRGFWDFVYMGSCSLLAILFGAAVGNVIRGVPLNGRLEFVGSFALALNPFAVLVGVLSLVYLALHGTIYIATKTPLEEHRLRAERVAKGLFAVVVVLILAATGAAYATRPTLLHNFTASPALFALPLLALAGAAAMGVLIWRRKSQPALVASAATLACLMGSAGASLYPSLLPGLTSGDEGLTIYNASSATPSMAISAALLIVGLLIFSIYGIYIHKVFAGRVDVESDGYVNANPAQATGGK